MNYRYTANCTKDQLRKIRAFVNESLSNYELSEVEINEMVLAVDEICANLIIHSCACDPDYSIDLSIKVDNGHILFEFVNRGESFDILGYKEPSIDDLIRRQRKGGLGLMLVNRIMDKIEYRKEEGNDVYRLYKKV